MRAVAHATDSILEALETEDTKYFASNALRIIFNILNGLYTALGSLSKRWWHHRPGKAVFSPMRVKYSATSAFSEQRDKGVGVKSSVK